MPRAELAAVIWAARKTKGAVTILVDASYVVNGHLSGKGLPGVATTNADLWQEWRQVLAGRSGDVTLVKVKSHCGAGDVQRGTITVPHMATNAFADAAAEKAAEVAGESVERVGPLLDWVDDRAWQVQKRLLVVGLHVAKQAQQLYQEKMDKARVTSPPPPPKADWATVQDEATKAGHQLSLFNGEKLARCQRCFRSGCFRQGQGWWKEQCRGPLAFVHDSHRLAKDTIQGKTCWICLVCGLAHAEGLLQGGLAKVCSRPSQRGLQDIRNFGKGRLPSRLAAAWSREAG